VNDKVFCKKVSEFLLVLGLAVLSFGCAAAVVGGAAGAGAVLYSKGELKSTENGSVSQVFDAAIETMNSMQFNVVTKDQDSLKAKVLAKKSNGDNIDIKLEQKPNNLTEMKIRVGAFGNEDQARLIQEKIRERINNDKTGSR
jgi:Protein of unknown function (DUF3568)